MPWQFLALTPRELVLLLEGEAARQELTDVRLSWLLSCWSGKAITAEELRGQPLRYLQIAKPKPMKPHEIAALIASAR